VTHRFCSRWRCLGAALITAGGLAGCAGRATAKPTSASSNPSASSGRSTEPSARPPAVTLASCGAAVDVSSLHAVHHFTESPDDVAIDPAGRLWVTAREVNLLISVNADGSGVTSQSVAGGPEGIAINASGMYVVQQNLNAIAAITPTRHALITFPNRTANAGTDGIGSDPATQRLLVPDSPTGQLFAVPLTGPPTPQLIAGNLGRPVAATTDSAGDIIVASESAPGLTVLTPAGSRHTLGHFANLDEVVAFAGLLYVTDLDHHDVVAVDPLSGVSVPIAVNLPAPQGLAVTSTGDLEIVDATTNMLYSMPACGAQR